ncbi:Uncharacterised protein [Shigella sonnei]|nr:Uncharacterised protein [Shigella sonnei]
MLFFARCFYCFWRFLYRLLRTRFTFSAFFAAWRGRTWLAFAARCVFFLTSSCGSFAFFRLLFSTLCLNTRFRFFKLLASMLYMLLVQLTAWVAVKIDTRCAGFNTVKITPARSVET